MKTEILVVGHKKFHKPLFKNEYKKIFVGPNQANLASGQDYRDSSGDNIAEKNANYNEMTAIYWAWKNLDLDNYGFCHYRRFLKYDGKLLDKKTIDRLLQTYDVIVPKVEKYGDGIRTYEEIYLETVKYNDVDLLRGIITKNHPEWLNAFNHVMSEQSGNGHMRNTFIMTNQAFDSYCSFIFTLLFELEEIVPKSEITGQRTRMFGFLSEKLLDVWIENNQANFVEAEMIFSELGMKRVNNKVKHLMKGAE
ncbi:MULTISPECIES: DUF4422 domain-containing protein [unclassified Lactococcus]|uniref:DUF4422 domain-containing protein n=1 Tax=unclassified Lactococcus TaxID=2643510 RepID=UPI0011C7D10E|nr:MULTISPECIES: DUF4422 domain-containing protein [unclassified Lactococcus]MQW22589.1 DUF4422 domain-containing protein [Lactococcus sp. dk101]TXK45612.1 DUF4422 domain-containing protein [Lactococcus sp. dk310]TXK51462.1 DUF4422 domain-containing protein [Lactococcus sp. dk322]